uniref:NADH dehydrogenase subunit 4 n=1 Tax=Gunungiella acanthoclada TaxID=3025504 RepID=UPI0024347EFA|nr:NADH dehydrogenase subunit 4 [Gunungiella acanthoclada]WEU80058.1 NADH dehydrogenase subunit 4 [Gunungiella acanthoclada]
MLKYLIYMIFMVLLGFSYLEVFGGLMILFILFMMNSLNLALMGGLGYSMGMDVLSWGLIMLSIWIVSLMIISSFKIYKLNIFSDIFGVLNLVLLFMLMLVFFTTNLFMFYIFFESSLLPLLMLIIGWGYQVERIQAGVYLLFYTLFVSLPLLMVIKFIYLSSYTLMFCMVEDLGSFIIYLIMLLAFMVKMPMFMVHLWLPKAHVEAPVSGSMILAGVMLKLGGYGLMRVLGMNIIVGVKMNFIWVILSMIGGLYLSLMCLLQVDMKMLIAYSSVVHMVFVIGGLMTVFKWGFVGCYGLMLGHGLCSSGLFCISNMYYERLGSRSLVVGKGLLNLLPSLSMWMFLLLVGNMAAPVTLNLIGEISLMISIVSWSVVLMVVLMMVSFFSASYSIYLYTFSQHGMLSSSLFSFSQVSLREYIVLFLHWFFLNFLILKVEWFMLSL